MIYLPKSQDAPPCLMIEKQKVNGNCNCEGVLDALKKDFNNKCYICETKGPHSINNEHFKPHRGNKDLKFDWENLFYCCVHCNNNKGDREEFDDILNCTVDSDGVDIKIKYEINPFPREKVIITALENTNRVNNTVKLLNEVYNGTTPLKLIESANIRAMLLKEIRNFQDLLFEYDDDSYTNEEKLDLKSKIVRDLRSTSNFTAFKRWIIRNSQHFAPDFSEHI